MATVILKGVVYDTDGNTPITSVVVNVTVYNSTGNILGAAKSATTNGVYSVTYQTTLLNADHWITVEYQRENSTFVVGIGNLSGLVANTINPQVPT